MVRFLTVERLFTFGQQKTLRFKPLHVIVIVQQLGLLVYKVAQQFFQFRDVV